MSNKIVEKVLEVVQPIADENDLLIWDIEYKSGNNAMLTILLDKKDHQDISMDEISDATQLISENLDEIEPDPFDDTYMLDISSPGVFRTLLNQEHYSWAKDMPVIVSVFKKINDQKNFEGLLKEYTEDSITIQKEEGKIDFNFADISKIQLNQEV